MPDKGLEPLILSADGLKPPVYSISTNQANYRKWDSNPQIPEPESGAYSNSAIPTKYFKRGPLSLSHRLQSGSCQFHKHICAPICSGSFQWALSISLRRCAHSQFIRERPENLDEVGLEPTVFLCHRFTVCYPRHWATHPKRGLSDLNRCT